MGHSAFHSGASYDRHLRSIRSRGHQRQSRFKDISVEGDRRFYVEPSCAVVHCSYAALAFEGCKESGAATLVQFLHSETWISPSLTWNPNRPAALHPVEVLDSPASIMKGDLCGTGIQLSEGECQQRMMDFPLWDLAPDSRSISRTFVAKDFAEGMKFFNQIAQLADVAGGHYPNLHLTDSRTVNLVLSTPAVKGLTIPDFNLARQIDRIYVQYSSKWLKANPHVIGILMNQDQDMSDIKRPPDIKTSRKGISGIGELLRVGQVAQGLPPLQEQEDFDALKHGRPELFSDDDLEERLKFLSNWKLSPDRRSISRTFQARNFAEGIKFFNAVAKLAEEYGHPPDLHLTEFRKVMVVLTTQQIQGLLSLDITMAERINNIDVQYSETAKDFEFSLQSTLPQDPEISPPQVSEVERSEDSSQMQPVLERQPSDTSSQQQGSEAAKPQSRTANKISFSERQHVTSLMERSGEGEEAQKGALTQKDSPTLLHSLILIFADAGAGGLAIQEAVRRMKKQGLPGLREKGKAVQVAKITRNHPDFVACDNVGCFALRKSLLRSFQCGSLDPEEYADEKKMEATVFEKYAASAAALPELKLSPRSSLHTPNQKT